MHPYRDPYTLQPQVTAVDEGSRLAFGVMTIVGAVQVASAMLYPGAPWTETLFGAACFLVGVVWLVRHRDRP